MAGFHATLDELWASPRPRPCSTWAAARACSPSSGPSAWATGRVVGIDLDDPKLAAEWERAGARTSSSGPRRPPRSSFADGEFDLATAIEVLEHVPEPEATLAEMARVARRRLLVSVPREPLWRGLNVARGAYLRELGNTPGHVNHWSKRAFAALLSRYGGSSRCARRSRGRCCSSECD